MTYNVAMAPPAPVPDLALPAVLGALTRCNYDRAQAASALGVSVDVLVAWLAKHHTASLVREGDRHLLAALEAFGGNRRQAARSIGVGHRVIDRFLERAPDVALRFPGRVGRRSAEEAIAENEGKAELRARLRETQAREEQERATADWINGLLAQLTDKHHRRVSRLLGNDTLTPEERRARLMVLVEDKLFPRASDQRFLATHRRHPEVLKMLEREAEALLRRGFRHLSGKALFELVRLRHAHRARRPPLNNYDTARYARLLVAMRPEWAPLFEFRRLADPSSLRAEQAQVTPVGRSPRRSRAPERD